MFAIINDQQRLGYKYVNKLIIVMLFIVIDKLCIATPLVN